MYDVPVCIICCVHCGCITTQCKHPRIYVDFGSYESHIWEKFIRFKCARTVEHTVLVYLHTACMYVYMYVLDYHEEQR
jgi:hypothetical protein